MERRGSTHYTDPSHGDKRKGAKRSHGRNPSPPKSAAQPRTNSRPAKLAKDDSDDVPIPQWVIEEARPLVATLKAAWNNDQTPLAVVYRAVYQILQSSSNPYWTVAYLWIHCDGWRQKKGDLEPLPLFLMRALAEWQKVAGPAADPPSRFLGAELKLAILARILQGACSDAICQTLSRLYRLDEDRSDIHLLLIRGAIQRGQYEAACRSIGAFGLYDAFEPSELLFQLFVKNKMDLIERYLDGSKAQQRTFLGFLDALFVRKHPDLVEQAVAQADDPKVMKVWLKSKNLKEVAFRLAKRFDVDPDCFPNLAHWQHLNALWTLMRTHYDEGTMAHDDWFDVVVDFVRDSNVLQRKAVSHLMAWDDHQMALECIRKWQLPEMPKKLVAAIATGQPLPRGRYKNVPNPSIRYYRPVLPLGFVQLVDTEQKFDQCTASLAKGVPLVAIACECRPVFHREDPKVAMLQLATRGRIYLLDVLVLKLVLSQVKWLNLNGIISNPNIIKLHFAADLNVIAAVDQVFGDIGSRKDIALIDLRDVSKQILQKNPHVFPFYPDRLTSCPDLSNFVSLCCGFALDKSEQSSNWERRPLRATQVCHAALDAYCLLDIYKVFRDNCTRLGVEFPNWRQL